MGIEPARQLVRAAAGRGVEIGAGDVRFQAVSENALRLLETALAEHVTGAERVAICLPVLVVDRRDRFAGAVLLVDQRAVLAWSEGQFRPRTNSLAIDYSDIHDVRRGERSFGHYAVPRQTISFAAGDRHHEIVLYSEITDHAAIELLLTAFGAVAPAK